MNAVMTTGCAEGPVIGSHFHEQESFVGWGLPPCMIVQPDTSQFVVHFVPNSYLSCANWPLVFYSVARDGGLQGAGTLHD